MTFVSRGVVLLVLATVFGRFADGTILPPNNLHLFDNVNRIENINEEKFNKIIDEVMNEWMPIAQVQGVTLKADKKWEDATVNAYAEQVEKVWTVYMYGGLARREEVTEDGFSLVVCHELGHHFAGHYFYESANYASEGQSDYFATQVCLKHLWREKKDDNKKAAETAPEIVKDKCKAIWGEANEEQINLCVRSSLAGLSVAKLLAALSFEAEPKFDAPDTSTVKNTVTYHPRAQCRLDTYFSGSLCKAAFDRNVIPGKTIAAGNNSKEAEEDAAKHSCMKKSGFEAGLRPACWFKSQLE